MEMADIRIKIGNRELTCKKGDKLQDVLLRQGIYLPRPCGGIGKCGKCKVRVTAGSVDVTASDRNCLTKEEIEKGIRLACQARITDSITIAIESEDEGKVQIAGAFPTSQICGAYHQEEGRICGSAPSQMLGGKSSEGILRNASHLPSSYGVAVDLGTTTLAFSLISLSDGEVRGSYACMNPQGAYGADVLSRIQAANQGMGEKLRYLVQKRVCHGIEHMLEEDGISVDKVKKIVLSGNTTMLHLLRGYSCQGLGTAPFAPVSLEQETLSSKEALGCKDFPAEVVLLPGASAFIGADIISGLFACGWDELEGMTLFLDLGTNGEMALGDSKGFYTASTAAGPAFEGGNIACGVGSIKGAICKANMRKGKLLAGTIFDAPPLGICGTGLIELAAEMLQAGVIDETGKLSEKYFESGFPVAEKQDGEMIKIYQKDIRQLQLAKAAVRAGIEVLLRKTGIGYNDIRKVYLAGGFGFYLDKKKAASIGLLPKELFKKTDALGNTSLKGGERYLMQEDAGEALRKIVKGAKEISLADEPEFQNWYLKFMDFPEGEK